MSTMCRRLVEALMTLSGTSSCFPRPRRTLADGNSQENSQTRIANGQPSTTTRSADNPTTSSQPSAHPYQTNSLKGTFPSPQALTRQTTSSASSSRSSSTTPVSSLRSLPSTLRASLNYRISSWRSNRPSPWPLGGAVESTTSQAFTPEDHVATTTNESSSDTDNDDFIASLDALALSEHEREVLGRMQLVCSSARAARKRRLEPMPTWSHADEIGSAVEPALHLRGGASATSSSSSSIQPFRTPRRRTTLPPEDLVFPKADSDRPPRGLWWLAGGRGGQVPTVGELRVRKEVERANRRRAGFWGTVLGVRRVGRVGILNGEGDGDGDGDGVGGGLEDVEAGSLHGNRSDGSVVGAPGAGSGGSLASSHRERQVEVDQPVEAKAESVMSVASADDGSGHENGHMVDEPAENHECVKPDDAKGAGAEHPKARSESAKSVADYHEYTKSHEMMDPGVEEPKMRSEY